jgi:hypothetical protein
MKRGTPSQYLKGLKINTLNKLNNKKNESRKR